MRIPRRPVLVVLAATAALLAATVRDAVATTADVVAPADRSIQGSGFTGPVSVRYGSDLSPGTFTVRVSGGAYLWEDSRAVSSPGTIDYTITPVTDPGGYVIQVYEGANLIAGSSFRLEAPDAAAITAPASGRVFVEGATPGGVSVAWSSVADGGNLYTVALSGPHGQVKSCSYTGAGLPGTTTVCALPALTSGSYTAAVRDVTSGSQLASSSFTVVPRIAVNSTSLAPSPFFPFEHDGFRDTTAFGFTLTRSAYVTVTVRNHLHAVVRTLALGLIAGGSHTVLWAGRNNAGHPVLPGTFTFGVAAQANGLVATGAPRSVIAAVGLITPASTVAPVDFYPLVVDGFRDRTTLSFALNKPAHVLFQARTVDGTVLRRIDLGLLGAGRHAVAWYGGRDNGSRVEPGTYQLRVVASTLYFTKPGVWHTVRVHAGSAG